MKAAYDQFAKRWTYKCDGCGRLDHWGPSWTWYGSIHDSENNNDVHACSDECMTEARRKYRPLLPGARR